MIKIPVVVLVLLGLQIGQTTAAPFRNLGFDEGPYVPGVREGSIDEFLPGWKVTGDRPSIDLRIDILPSGYDLTVLYSTNVQNTTGQAIPAKGRYSLTLVPNRGLSATPYTLHQTGDVPAGSEVIHFEHFWDDRVTLSLNNTSIPLVYVPRPTEGPFPAPGFRIYDVYGDVSGFAGQTVDLKITTIPAEDSFVYGLDSISFLVPEPSSWVLMILGAVFLVGLRRVSR